MIEDDLGFWWPVGTPGEVAYRATRLKNAKAVAGFVSRHVGPRRRQCVQAGGHVGLWAKHLSLLFNYVYTFEPDAANFAALGHNIQEPNVFAARGVLGCFHHTIKLGNTRAESGSHYVASSAGAVPTYRIDDLGLRQLDLIVLDVEGSELPALLGAEHSIREQSPAIILEVGGWNSDHGYGSATDWLRMMGYGEGMPVVGKDLCFQKESR